jgi:hypothetical protein
MYLDALLGLTGPTFQRYNFQNSFSRHNLESSPVIRGVDPSFAAFQDLVLDNNITFENSSSAERQYLPTSPSSHLRTRSPRMGNPGTNSSSYPARLKVANNCFPQIPLHPEPAITRRYPSLLKHHVILNSK